MTTIERVRRRFVEEGLAAALTRKKQVHQRILVFLQIMMFMIFERSALLEDISDQIAQEV
ncbi:MAG: hypothetical protein ACFBSE_09695 [Prochloraceae cyanobacterium]